MNWDDFEGSKPVVLNIFIVWLNVYSNPDRVHMKPFDIYVYLSIYLSIYIYIYIYI